MRISSWVTAKLICVFVFSCAKSLFAHDGANLYDQDLAESSCCCFLLGYFLLIRLTREYMEPKCFGTITTNTLAGYYVYRLYTFLSIKNTITLIKETSPGTKADLNLTGNNQTVPTMLLSQFNSMHTG